MAKPHRMKKLSQKAQRKASIKPSSYQEDKIFNNSLFLKPFDAKIAKEMLLYWKKEREHMHLKIKPHHHKRTTPRSVDAENPLTISGHSINDKTMKTKNKGTTQKSFDQSQKFQRNNYKKAA